MNINIELTKEQEKWLKLFAKNQKEGSKDNVGTVRPIHVVQTRREHVTEEGYEDKIVFISKDDGHKSFDNVEDLVKSYYAYDECPIEIVSFEEAYNQDEFFGVYGDEYVIINENDYLEAYGIDADDYIKQAIIYEYEDVAYFFILENAKKYIEYQGHNLDHPRTYTKGGGYSNYGDYEPFWDLLMAMGEKLNKI